MLNFNWISSFIYRKLIISIFHKLLIIYNISFSVHARSTKRRFRGSWSRWRHFYRGSSHGRPLASLAGAQSNRAALDAEMQFNISINTINHHQQRHVLSHLRTLVLYDAADSESNALSRHCRDLLDQHLAPGSGSAATVNSLTRRRRHGVHHSPQGHL